MSRSISLPIVVVALVITGQVGIAVSVAAGTPDPRRVKVELRDDGFCADGRPMFIFAHYANGQQKPGFSAKWTNAVLDVSGLSDEQYVLVAVQFERSTATLLSTVCNEAYAAIRIDKDGVVFPNEVNKVRTGGPFLRMELCRKEAGETKQVDPSGLQISATAASGKKLTCTITEDHEVIVSEVPRETVRIRLKDTTSSAEWSGDVYPYIRGSIPGIVWHKLQGVTVGDIVEPKTVPTQEESSDAHVQEESETPLLSGQMTGSSGQVIATIKFFGEGTTKLSFDGNQQVILRNADGEVIAGYEYAAVDPTKDKFTEVFWFPYEEEGAKKWLGMEHEVGRLAFRNGRMSVGHPGITLLTNFWNADEKATVQYKEIKHDIRDDGSVVNRLILRSQEGECFEFEVEDSRGTMHWLKQVKGDIVSHLKTKGARPRTSSVAKD